MCEYFPAALAAFEDLDAPDALELLGKAPALTAAYAATVRSLIAVIWVTLNEQVTNRSRRR
jgi:hypothetical protein